MDLFQVHLPHLPRPALRQLRYQMHYCCPVALSSFPIAGWTTLFESLALFLLVAYSAQLKSCANLNLLSVAVPKLYPHSGSLRQVTAAAAMAAAAQAETD